LDQATQNQVGLLAKGPLIDAKAQISADSSIGQSTRVEERASIKKSVIGRHCVIGKMTKIVGCVVLDHCVIEDGYVIYLIGVFGGASKLITPQSEARRLYTWGEHESWR